MGLRNVQQWCGSPGGQSRRKLLKLGLPIVRASKMSAYVSPFRDFKYLDDLRFSQQTGSWKISDERCYRLRARWFWPSSKSHRSRFAELFSEDSEAKTRAKEYQSH